MNIEEARKFVGTSIDFEEIRYIIVSVGDYCGTIMFGLSRDNKEADCFITEKKFTSLGYGLVAAFEEMAKLYNNKLKAQRKQSLSLIKEMYCFLYDGIVKRYRLKDNTNFEISYNRIRLARRFKSDVPFNFIHEYNLWSLADSFILSEEPKNGTEEEYCAVMNLLEKIERTYYEDIRKI